MKKLLLVLLFCFGFVSTSFAYSSLPWDTSRINFITDNSAEYLLNYIGPGDPEDPNNLPSEADLLNPNNWTTDQTGLGAETNLDIGDRLRGMFTVDQISAGATNNNLAATFGTEFNGIFDLTVTGKVDTGTNDNLGNALFDYTFGTSAFFEAEHGGVGSGEVLAFYIDDFGDAVDYNRLSLTPDDLNGNVVEEQVLSTATSGDLYWTFGLVGAGTGWEAEAAPEDVSTFKNFSSQGAGSVDIALNLVNNVLGPDLSRTITSPYGADVDFAATTGLIGIKNQSTPMDIFDNLDGELAPIPEPASMCLFGFGLIGLAFISRRRR